MPIDRSSGDLSWREEQMQQAHLLLLRGRHGEAMGIIRALRTGGPAEVELEDLYARAAAATEAAKEAKRRRRHDRWTLGLNSSWKRACWWFWSTVFAVYGVWGLSHAVAVCRDQGMHAMVTVRYHTGRYGTGPLVTDTHEAWVDLLVPSGAIAAAVIGMIVVWTVGRGAEDWEDLDSTSDFDVRPGSVF